MDQIHVIRHKLLVEGQSQRQVSQQMGLSRNTVKLIIQQEGEPPPAHPRADKHTLDEELLRRLYQQCQGWVVRVHEKLVEEEGVHVSYSTLKRRLWELGISAPPQTRCARVPDEPGAEMQHDTSPYQLELGGTRTRPIASLLTCATARGVISSSTAPSTASK